MAFHKTSLGRLGESLPSDLNGYVPQEGDQPEDFTWDPRTEWTPSSWSLFVEGAVQATLHAEIESQRVGDDPGQALVAEATGIAERARDAACQEDRELLTALRTLYRQAELVARILSQKPLPSTPAQELSSLLRRTRMLIAEVEQTLTKSP